MISADVFTSEDALVASFVTRLQALPNPWGPLDVGLEFFYHRGRTDVVASTGDGDVIAFEAKLTRWREALQQAYRNTCFAHRSYVVLPRAAARIACLHERDFSRRHVGLCYIEQGELVVAFHPSRVSPLQPWLSELASRFAKHDASAPEPFYNGGQHGSLVCDRV